MALLVEDDLPAARTIQFVLERAAPVVAARTVREALDLIHDRRALLGAVIDLGLPDGSGFDVLVTLRRYEPELPVLVLTASHEPASINRAHELGASYACKPAIADAVRVFVAKLAQRAPGGALQRHLDLFAAHHGLTPRETNILAYAVADAGRAAIADELGVTLNTLKTEIRRLLCKTSQPTLVLLAASVRAELRSGKA